MTQSSLGRRLGDAGTAPHQVEECGVCRGVPADSAREDIGRATQRDPEAPDTECKYVTLLLIKSFQALFFSFNVELTFELAMAGPRKGQTTGIYFGACLLAYVLYACVRK